MGWPFSEPPVGTPERLVYDYRRAYRAACDEWRDDSIHEPDLDRLLQSFWTVLYAQKDLASACDLLASAMERAAGVRPPRDPAPADDLSAKLSAARSAGFALGEAHAHRETIKIFGEFVETLRVKLYRGWTPLSSGENGDIPPDSPP